MIKSNALVNAAAKLLANSECFYFHIKVDQAVRNVLTEVDLGFYHESEAINKLKSKVFNIQLAQLNGAR